MCCGAAGTYNLTQPAIAGDLADRKLANVDRIGGVDAIVTGNAGCILHLGYRIRETGRAYSVVHPIELLDLAYHGRGAAANPA
jgi:glycolate oxidase iron-sulfur subunit